MLSLSLPTGVLLWPHWMLDRRHATSPAGVQVNSDEPADKSQKAPQRSQEPPQGPLSPEALSAYLSAKHCDPDAIQQVLIDYMTWTGPPIRYPKAWAWRRVHWRTIDAVRKDIRSKVAPGVAGPSPDALTQALQRQKLERFVVLMKGPKLARNPRWQLWRQRGV